MPQCFEKLRITSGRKYFWNCVWVTLMGLNRDKNIISFLVLPDKIQNNTNTENAWDILLVKNYLLFIWNSNLTGHLALLFSKSGSLTHFPSLPLVVPRSWSEIPIGDVCGDGKGQTVIGSLAMNTGWGGSPRRSPSWNLETPAYWSPSKTLWMLGSLLTMPLLALVLVNCLPSCPQPPPHFCPRHKLILILRALLIHTLI